MRLKAALIQVVDGESQISLPKVFVRWLVSHKMLLTNFVRALSTNVRIE